MYLPGANGTILGPALSPSITDTYPHEFRTGILPLPKLPYALRSGLHRSPSLGKGVMAENLELLNTAVSLLIRAALLAARFSGRVRQRSVKRLASRDVDAKAKEILFLKDRVYQLEMQLDTTKVRCWGLWPIHVLVAIDHFSRKVVCLVPLEGPNAGWIVEALEQAMRKHGGSKHIISDQALVFVGDAFAELLKQWNIKPRFGAVGKHGSIAVTERVIKTLKYERLRCVPLIKGFDHLTSLYTEFESWYNACRPHMTLEGFRPDDLYYGRKPETPKRQAKTIPGNIERHVFAETRLTAYRLKNAA